MRTSISGIGFALTLAFAAQAHAAETDWTEVDTALGKTASVQGQVHRYGIPRSDLQVTLDGVAIKPALALGGWLGFEPMQDGAVVMGDTANVRLWHKADIPPALTNVRYRR